LLKAVKKGIQVPEDFETVRGAKAFVKLARVFEDKVLRQLFQQI